MQSIVSVSNLQKHYGRTEALRGVSFDVDQGEIYGIIGPDGAGKTSLFRILTTLILPDGGNAQVAGCDVVKDYRHLRSLIGYMPGRFSLYQDLSVEENLQFFATVFNTTVEANYDLIADIYRQIEPFKKRRAGKLSGGMKQKLALSCALIHKPTVLFLDEPTTGVDPVSRKEFWAMLGQLKRQGLTILVSTPYMDEAAQCDRIALIKDGSFMQVETPRHIVEGYTETLWTVRSDSMHRLLHHLRTFAAVKTAFSFGEAFHVTVCPGTDPATLYAWLQAKGHHDVVIQPVEATIEDCFMLLTNKS